MSRSSHLLSFRSALVAVFVCCRIQTVADDQPNIVFILADDLGYHELGSFGQQLIRTPNLDRLAIEGMKLTQHYCGNAVCAPSRCVLMTGKHPGHAFIRSNRSTPPEGQLPIPCSEITIGELLQQNDYVNGAFGKWGLGGPDSSGVPLQQGFDQFFGYLCQSQAHSYYPPFLRVNDSLIELNNNPPVPGHASLASGADPTNAQSYRQFQGQDYAPDRINAAALDFIRRNKNQPFFCYYPTMIPHVALHVPDEDLTQYHELGWNDPPFTRAKGRGYTPHFTPRAAYAAMITRMDRYVGRVLDLLDELQLSDNTLIVFSSDNGTTHLKDEVDYDFFKSVGELRGLKGSLYEGGVLVPTIVRWPGKVQPGTFSNRVSGFEDWMPTLMEVVDDSTAVLNDCDGISLLPTLLGQTQPERPFLYREFTGYGGQQSVRVGDWKAVRQSLGKGRGVTELYDLKSDPGEQYDVAAEQSDVLQQLIRVMDDEHIPSAQFPIPVLDGQTRR